MVYRVSFMSKVRANAARLMAVKYHSGLQKGAPIPQGSRSELGVASRMASPPSPIRKLRTTLLYCKLGTGNA